MPSPWIECAHPAGAQLRVLFSPYKTVDALDFKTNPPAGTIVFGHGLNVLEVLAGLTAAVYRWPWAIPCIAIPLDQGSLEPLLMLVSELRGRLGVVKQARSSAVGVVSAILAAVRNRPVPDLDVLTDWLGRRLDNLALRDAVAVQFREALGGQAAASVASASTYSRLFARFGPYTSRDWRAIARLCVHCVATDSFTRAQTLPMRTASHHLKKYVHLPYHTVADHVGWEWVLEYALRVGRYVKART